MSSGWWFAVFPSSALPEMAGHRLTPGWEALRDTADGSWWLRGPARGDTIPPAILRAGPTATFLAETSLGPLTPAGGRVPRRMPPAGPWRPLPKVIIPVLPAASLPVPSPEKLPIRFARATRPQPLKGALTTLARLDDTLSRVPAAWCSGLSFAASAAGEVLVLGLTHSFLPGTPLTAAHGVAWPVSLCFDPEGIEGIVASALALRPGDCAFFRGGDSPPEVIPGECLLPLSRAAVRATRKEDAHG